MKRVGEGALSEVFQAMHIPSRTTVAVKLYTKASLTHFTRRQIEREVELQSRLRHPHIVQLVSTCYALLPTQEAASFMMDDTMPADLCIMQLMGNRPSSAKSRPAYVLTGDSVLPKAFSDWAAVGHHPSAI